MRLLPQRVQHASAYPGSSVSHNKFQLLYSLLVSSHTNKSTKDNLKFHSQNSSTGSPTTVYSKLAQLSRRKGHNYTDSQAHSQAVSQACRCLGWQNRGVSERGEASPSSSATKQNNFYPVLNCLVLFVSSHKSTKDNLKFPSQHSSTGSPTTVYSKLAQLSRRKGHNYADSRAHSQAGCQACRCLGWQNRGVSERGEASPSSSATKQNNFYPVFNCLVLFHHDLNKCYDPKISVFFK